MEVGYQTPWSWVYGAIRECTNIQRGHHSLRAVKQVEPGKPEQFCSMVKKLGEGPLAVSAYPVAWRIEVVDEGIHRGFEYVRSELHVILRDYGDSPTQNNRVYWGTTGWSWNVDSGVKENGTKVEGSIALRNYD